jgi:hypothetical protein
MKYLIVKALLGFGDRLESLKMCVDYAIKYDLAICVDWSDKTWGESFYRYFSLDLPLVNIEDIPEESTVYPAYWAGKIAEKLTIETANENATEIEIGQLTAPLPYDVIVTICSGRRNSYIDSGFFASRFRVIDDRVLTEVKRRVSVYDLHNRWGIHLRGTDRAFSLAYKQKRMSELTIKLVGHGLFNGPKMIAVSDDKEYIDIWKARFPDSPIISNITTNTGIIGRHMVTSCKDDTNVELLVDFFTLMCCSRIYSTSPDSRFAQEAQRLSPYVNEILRI